MSTLISFIKSTTRFVGGVRQLVLVPGNKLATLTFDQGELVTLSLGTNDKAVVVPFDQYSGSANWESKGTPNGRVEDVHKLEFEVSRIDFAAIRFLEGIRSQSGSTLLAIVRDFNGIMKVYGLTTAGQAIAPNVEISDSTGKAPSDDEGGKAKVTITWTLFNPPVVCKVTSQLGTITNGEITQNIIIAGS